MISFPLGDDLVFTAILSAKLAFAGTGQISPEAVIDRSGFGDMVKALRG